MTITRGVIIIVTISDKMIFEIQSLWLISVNCRSVSSVESEFFLLIGVTIMITIAIYENGFKSQN